jgi:hypothetical protein
MMSRLLTVLHESETIEEMLVASQVSSSCALIRRRRSIDLFDYEQSRQLDTLALSAQQLIPLRANVWLAICAESSQFALIAIRDANKLAILSSLQVALPSDWPPVGTRTVAVCCHSSRALRVFALFIIGSAAHPLRFSVRLGPPRECALLECVFFAHVGEVAAPVAVVDAVAVSDADGTPCVALLHVPRGETTGVAVSERALDLSFYAMRDVTAVQQWALGDPLWVASRVAPRLMSTSEFVVGVLSVGSLYRLTASGQEIAQPPIDCHRAKPPVAYCAVAPDMLCFVAKSGELGIVVGSKHYVVDCSQLVWPFDPPHSVVARRLANGRVVAAIASRCNVRLVTFDLNSNGPVVRKLVDGAIATRLPIADAHVLDGGADIVFASDGGSVSTLHRVSFGAQLVTESRSDGDLGVAKLLSVCAFLGSARATVVVVTDPVASTSQAFVLDEFGVPSAHEVLIDETSTTLALVPCHTLMAVQAAALQVTPDAVNDIGQSGWIALWRRPSDLPRVDVVAQCGTFVALACGSTLLLCRLFDVIDDAFQVLTRRTFGYAIGAVALTTACAEPRPLVAVSLWTTNDVLLLESSELKTVSSASSALSERATAMCWLEKAAGSGEQFGAQARLLLVVGCGDGSMHLYAVDGLQLSSERMSVSVGVSAVSLLPLCDDDESATSSVLALCASGTLTTSAAMLLHVKSSGASVLHVVNADAIRSACALDATPRTMAWLSASDGALVVGQVRAPTNDTKQWSATRVAERVLAISAMARGEFIVVLFESFVAVYAAAKDFSDPVSMRDFDGEAIDMLTLSDNSIVVHVKRREDRCSLLLSFAFKDGHLSGCRDFPLGQFGVMCRLDRSMVCVAQAYPPRLLVLDSALAAVGLHNFADGDSEFQFNELLPVGRDGFVCALSHVGARLFGIRDGELVLNVPLAMPSTTRFCECALLDTQTLVAFDFGGGATVYDLGAVNALARFRHNEFEVPHVDALPFVRYDRNLGGGDRVLRSWRVDELSVCMQSYLAPHTSHIDTAVEVPLLLAMASGELQLRSFVVVRNQMK